MSAREYPGMALAERGKISADHIAGALGLLSRSDSAAWALANALSSAATELDMLVKLVDHAMGELEGVPGGLSDALGRLADRLRCIADVAPHLHDEGEKVMQAAKRPRARKRKAKG